jgi:hypothetical protein
VQETGLGCTGEDVSDIFSLTLIYCLDKYVD